MHDAGGLLAAVNADVRLDVVVVDGQARGIIVRNLVTGAYERQQLLDEQVEGWFDNRSMRAYKQTQM